MSERTMCVRDRDGLWHAIVNALDPPMRHWLLHPWCARDGHLLIVTTKHGQRCVCGKERTP